MRANIVTRAPNGAVLINGKPIEQHKVASAYYPPRATLIQKRRREAADRARLMDRNPMGDD